MPPSPPNLEALVRVLTAENVRFVVIGGFALVLQGGRNTTTDSDFAIAADPENISSVIRALASLRPLPWHWEESTPFVWDERSIRGSNVGLKTSAGDVDLMLELPGVDSFEGLMQRSVGRNLGDIDFRVASLDDLAAMKRVANRPQDLLHLLEIDRIRAVDEIE